MELTELKAAICESFTGDANDLARILDVVAKDEAIYPFNEYEHLICNLMENGGLTFEKYMDIRAQYINENPNLWIFEISAPRGFGEKFAQTYIQGKCTQLQQATKEMDPSFSGEYDLWFDGVRVEVKASRAVDAESDEPLYIRALQRDTDRPFVMNFQQLKPQCCDVFVWVAVFRDEIVLWVMSSGEVAGSPLFSEGQHRGNSGNEGQLHIRNVNIHELDRFELGHGDLGQAIRDAAKR